jgi:hypothetical protein
MHGLLSTGARPLDVGRHGIISGIDTLDREKPNGGVSGSRRRRVRNETQRLVRANAPTWSLGKPLALALRVTPAARDVNCSRRRRRAPRARALTSHLRGRRRDGAPLPDL